MMLFIMSDHIAVGIANGRFVNAFPMPIGIDDGAVDIGFMMSAVVAVGRIAAHISQ